MRIALAADHTGIETKEKIKPILVAKGHEHIDCGSSSMESCDYPDYAAKAAQAVSDRRADVAILICGTGIGMSITANKFKGVRAAVCFNEEAAKLSRQHNDCNILCLGSRILSWPNIEKIVTVWLNTPFEGERHMRRVDKIKAIEEKNFNCR